MRSRCATPWNSFVRAASSRNWASAATLPVPTNILVTREIEIRGAFRFALGVELMNRGRVDVMPLVTATFRSSRPGEAFKLAGDRSKAAKVLLTFA